MNTYFITSPQDTPIEVEKFHLCTWNLEGETSLVELGAEICLSQASAMNDLCLSLYIPWVGENCKIKDLYTNLLETKNSKFIFNDSISGFISLDGGENKNGVIHKFLERPELAILPLRIDKKNGKINLKADLSGYNKTQSIANIYFRILIETNSKNLTTKKNGITKSTIIYDIKVNELRNVPDDFEDEIRKSQICNIKACFCFNIVPNHYSTVFNDNSLKNVRMLEYKSFKLYLNDDRLKNNELIVVFNKKEKQAGYTFFSIYNDEIIGTDQVAIAFLANLVCGILLFLPTFRKELAADTGLMQSVLVMPWELKTAIVILLLTIVYFRRLLFALARNCVGKSS